MRKSKDINSMKSKNVSVAPQSGGYHFLSNVIWVGLSQVFISLTGLVILPALTKNYSTQLYGVWTQMAATIGLLAILTLKFESATIRFLAAEENPSVRRQALGAMLWPIIILCGLLLCFSLLMSGALSSFLFAESQFTSYVPLVAIWASLEVFLLFLLSYQRAIGKIRLFASIRLASSFIKMLAIVSMAFAAASFYRIVVSVIFIQSAFVIGVFILVIAELGLPVFNTIDLKKYLLYSIPLIPGEMLLWVVNLSDRYFIAHMINISEAGIYSASYSLANLLNLISWPIGVVLFPVISRLWDRGERATVKSYFEYSVKLLLLVSLPASAGIGILSQHLLGYLATSEYEAGISLVLVLNAGIALAGVFLINEYIIYLVKKTIWLPIINGSGAFINIIINIALIPTIGIMGAAISTLAAFFVITLIVYLWGKQHIDYKLDYIFILKVVVATLIMSASIWFIDVNSIPGVFMVIIAGLSIYIVAIYLLKVFSNQDKELIKQVFTGLKSNFKHS